MQKSNLLSIGRGGEHRLRMSPTLWGRGNPLKIFIYMDEQTKRQRCRARRTFSKRDLQEFLGLETPIHDLKKVPKELANVNSIRFPEYLDICEERYDDIRIQIIRQGIRSSRWINEEFIESSDVVVSSKEHFRSLLSAWGEDPCQSGRLYRKRMQQWVEYHHLYVGEIYQLNLSTWERRLTQDYYKFVEALVCRCVNGIRAPKRAQNGVL